MNKEEYMKILEPKMKALDEERFHKQTKEVWYIEVYSAACSEGFASKLVTELEADFLIARQTLLWDRKDEESYLKRMKNLYSTPLGQKYYIRQDEHTSYLIRVNPFTVINKEFKK
jgi:uncharacterized membrane protein